MIKLNYYILTISLLLSSLSLLAQNDDGAELLKPFKAKLAVSAKKNSAPILPALDSSVEALKYDIKEHAINFKYPAPVIRPLSMSSSEKILVNNFYSKIGFGYPISPSAEISYFNKGNKNFAFGTNFKHLSSQGNVENQAFGNTHFDVGGTYFTKNKMAIGADLGFNLDAYRYYGYNQLRNVLSDSNDIFPDSVSIPKDSVSQRFFEFYTNIHFYNGSINKLNLDYRADLDFQVMNDKFGANEIILTPKFNIQKLIGKSNSKNRHRVFADILLNYAHYNFDSTTINRTVFNFHPGIELNFGKFKAIAATNLGSNTGSFYILPDLRLNLGLMNNRVNVYAGWTANVRTNTFRSFSNYLPFINSDVELKHSVYSEYFAGVNARLEMIKFDLKVAYAQGKNMALFLNDSTENYLKFSVLYDDFNVVNVKGTIDVNPIKNFNIIASATYNYYHGGNYERAYHLPVMESNLSLNYRINKLILKSEFYFNAAVPYFDFTSNSSAMLNSLYDLNFAASYWVGKKKENFGFFAEVNNVLNNKNQRWFLYPQIGFNARAGILLKF